jgi:hypothetical protein
MLGQRPGLGIRSAPTLNIRMTPFASVTMPEKSALLQIALCKAPVLSRAAAQRISVATSPVPGSPSRIVSCCIFLAGGKRARGLRMQTTGSAHEAAELNQY